MTLLSGVFAPSIIAQLPLHTVTPRTNLPRILAITNALDSGPRTGEVLVNNSGTLLGDPGTLDRSLTHHSGLAPGFRARSTAVSDTNAVSSQIGALTMDANDSIEITSQVPSRFDTFPAAPTISDITPNDGTSPARGDLEDHMPVQAVPEPSTWYIAALSAAFICFQCRGRSRKKPVLSLSLPQREHRARAFVPPWSSASLNATRNPGNR